MTGTMTYKVKDGSKTTGHFHTRLTDIFVSFLQLSQDAKEVIIYETLLGFVQKLSKHSLEDVVECLNIAIGERIHDKVNPIKYPYKEFNILIDLKDREGNTLLHHAVKHENTEAIKTLLKYGANPLIRNSSDQIPLDLAKGGTKETLIEGMREQASLRKGEAIYNSVLFGTILGGIPGVALAFGIGFTDLSCGIKAGLNIASILAPIVGIGIVTYFLSQDYRQAKAIENATENVVSSKLSVDGAEEHIDTKEQKIT